MEARVNFSGNELINSENNQLTLKLFHWVSAFTMRLGPTQRDFFSRGDSHELPTDFSQKKKNKKQKQKKNGASRGKP